MLATYQLSNEAIERASEAVIQQQGERALSEAARQVSVLNSQGLYSLAGTWQRIRHKIAEGWQPEDTSRDDPF
jgi:hypothetical protein